MYKRLITYLLLTAAILGAPVSDTQIANRVAQWQIDNFGRYLSKGDRRSDQHWANGALYRGMVVWAETSGYKPCEEFVLGIGRRNGWCMGRRQYHADDICVGQAYLMLYQRYGDTAMLRPVLQRRWSGLPSQAARPSHAMPRAVSSIQASTMRRAVSTVAASRPCSARRPASSSSRSASRRTSVLPVGGLSGKRSIRRKHGPKHRTAPAF